MSGELFANSGEGDGLNPEKSPMVGKRKCDNMDSGECSKKRLNESLIGNVSINESFYEPTFKDAFSKAFTEKQSSDFENGAKVISKPFTCGVLPNFIKPDEYLNALKCELLKLDFDDKSCDLFKLKQSKDFQSYSSNSIITKFRELLSENFIFWISEVSKMPLGQAVDMSCSIYNFTDVLLCHDDRLHSRKIAFIYYLVSDWEKEDGGLLDLFTCEKGSPMEVCTSIVPQWNNLIFFEVSPHSFHQVSEILSNKSRISISGWFHKSAVDTEESDILTVPIRRDHLREFINPVYLSDITQNEIRLKFENDSEIDLHDFLREDKYAKLCEELMSNEIDWNAKGPPNRRCYEESSTLKCYPPTLQKFIEFLSSDSFAFLMMNLTGLSIFSFDRKIKEKDLYSAYIRRWSHKNYTILYDEDNMNTYLDAMMYFNCTGYDAECGGVTTYFDKDQSIPLLTVEPKRNSLALVYIIRGISKFVKYVNSNIKRKMSVPHYHEIITTYTKPDDSEEGSISEIYEQAGGSETEVSDSNSNS